MSNVIDFKAARDARQKPGPPTAVETRRRPGWLPMSESGDWLRWLIAFLAAAKHRPGGFIDGMFAKIDDAAISPRQYECLIDAALRGAIIEDRGDAWAFTQNALDGRAGLTLAQFREKFCSGCCSPAGENRA
jgi:hypothetical protein